MDFYVGLFVVRGRLMNRVSNLVGSVPRLALGLLQGLVFLLQRDIFLFQGFTLIL